MNQLRCANSPTKIDHIQEISRPEDNHLRGSITFSHVPLKNIDQPLGKGSKKQNGLLSPPKIDSPSRKTMK